MGEGEGEGGIEGRERRTVKEGEVVERGGPGGALWVKSYEVEENNEKTRG